MLLQHCYQILGVPMHASEMQIKRAYRSKAKLLHPDANKNDDAKFQFQLLNEAYHQILKNLNQTIPVVESNDSETEYKKYGTSIRNKTYKASNRHRDDYNSPPKDEPLNRSPYDKYIFWFFLLLGINMLVYALLDVIKHKEDQFNYYNGLFATVPFLLLLIIGWNVIKKY